MKRFVPQPPNFEKQNFDANIKVDLNDQKILKYTEKYMVQKQKSNKIKKFCNYLKRNWIAILGIIISLVAAIFTIMSYCNETKTNIADEQKTAIIAAQDDSFTSTPRNTYIQKS